MDTGHISLDAYAALGYASLRNGGIGIDNDGRGWFISDKTGNVNAERTRILSEAYRFTTIVGNNTYGAILLGNPHDTSRDSATVQLPTTGAPSSDLLMPAVVVAVGVMFAGVMVSRRRAR